MKTILGVLFLALLGAGAYAAQPSDDAMHDTATTAADTPLEHKCDCLAETACEEKMKIADGRADFELTCERFSSDHFTIEGVALERIQWASIEGSGEDMLALATAIERRERMSSKRCALGWHESGDGLLWSPRNSMSASRVDAKRLVELVPKIRQKVAEPPEAEDLGDWDARSS